MAVGTTLSGTEHLSAPSVVIQEVPLQGFMRFYQDTITGAVWNTFIFQSYAAQTFTANMISWGIWSALASPNTPLLERYDGATGLRTTASASLVAGWNTIFWRVTDSQGQIKVNAGAMANNASNYTYPASTDPQFTLGSWLDSLTGVPDGRFAELAFWDGTSILTTEEIAALQAGMNPLETWTQKPTVYYPLHTNENHDLLGGPTLTDNNSPTIEDHSPQTIRYQQSSISQTATVAVGSIPYRTLLDVGV